LPAVPALALVCAPYLSAIAARTAARRVLFWIAAALAIVATIAIPSLLLYPEKRIEVIDVYELDPLAPLIAIAAATLIVCVLARPRRGFLAFAGVLTSVLLIVSFWINPAMNKERSKSARPEGSWNVSNA
jgi:hypothetical protein